MPTPPLPSVKSLVLADQVFRQAETGKLCIIGVFDKIFCSRFPTLHPSLGLFIRVEDAEGEYGVRIEFRDSADRVLGSFEGMTLQVNDRLACVSFGFQTEGLPLPGPGRYFFKLFFNDQATVDVPVDVQQMPPPGRSQP
ncbi:MAG: hypothetical protein HUU06_06640 [Planctomycetaceae bacterium]|nr:hypothetical protein [Planctomycetota bacterium]NUN52448.1 hypothetical protein [Planctomycetaceae bacterium]